MPAPAMTISGTPASPGSVIGSAAVCSTSPATVRRWTSIPTSPEWALWFIAVEPSCSASANSTNSFNNYNGSTVLQRHLFKRCNGFRFDPLFRHRAGDVQPRYHACMQPHPSVQRHHFQQCDAHLGNSFSSTLSGPITLIGNTTVSVSGYPSSPTTSAERAA